MYKMYTCSTKTWKKNGVEAINYDGEKWINQTQLGNALGHSNIASRTQYYSSEYKRKSYEIQDCEDYQPCRMFLKEELAVTIMMDTRTKAVEFRAKFKNNQHDPILTKEQSIVSKIVKAFSNEKIIEQFFVLKEKIDFYFPRHKLAMEVDELGHLDRNEEDETKRRKKLEERFRCTFDWINPDKENFDIFVELGKIESYISESNKKLTEESTKKSLINDLSKILLELKFKKHNSIKSNCVKWIVKKILSTV